MGEDEDALPQLDGMHFEVIPDDATRILRLQSGEGDAAASIPFSRVGKLQADPATPMNLWPRIELRGDDGTGFSP